ALTRLAPALQTRKEPSEGRVRLIFEQGPQPALDQPPSGLPDDVPRAPFLALTTGRSWAQVAAAYAKIVDDKIAPADVRGLAREITANATERNRRIARILARVHQDIRYTGVEFGEASIVPASPAETLKRRYGDCKDQATLLVALLRAAGIPAQVALLDTGPGGDVNPELPGLGIFDHAIVHVPANPPIWIDPTDDVARAGQLPMPEQGP